MIQRTGRARRSMRDWTMPYPLAKRPPFALNRPLVTRLSQLNRAVADVQPSNQILPALKVMGERVAGWKAGKNQGLVQPRRPLLPCHSKSTASAESLSKVKVYTLIVMWEQLFRPLRPRADSRVVVCSHSHETHQLLATPTPHTPHPPRRTEQTNKRRS